METKVVTIGVKSVFVKLSAYIYDMHTCHIDYVQTQNMARSTVHGNIEIYTQLYLQCVTNSECSSYLVHVLKVCID